MAEKAKKSGIEKLIEMQDIADKEPLSIEVTTECNSRCSHCFARAGLKEYSGLAAETAHQIMKEGFALGYRNLHITGGEPFLWPGLFELIGSALNTGYESIFCNTNGKLLTEKNCSRARAFGKSLTLSVSLQGYPKLHDAVRGSGSWEKTSKGIKTAVEAGLDLFVFTSAGKSLIKSLPRYTEFIFNEFKGIMGLTFIQMIRTAGDKPDLSDELLEPEDFMEMVRALSLLSLFGYPVDILENPLAAVVSHIMGMDWLPHTPPLHRPGKLVVLADKNVTLSHSSRESLGIYKEGRLKQFLEAAMRGKAVAPDSKICPNCRHIEKCRKFGMLNPSEWFRDRGKGAPFCMKTLDKCMRLIEKKYS